VDEEARKAAGLGPDNSAQRGRISFNSKKKTLKIKTFNFRYR
jgi:hypothetical protein